jgi:hypothetical protein
LLIEGGVVDEEEAKLGVGIVKVELLSIKEVSLEFEQPTCVARAGLLEEVAVAVDLVLRINLEVAEYGALIGENKARRSVSINLGKQREWDEKHVPRSSCASLTIAGPPTYSRLSLSLSPPA